MTSTEPIAARLRSAITSEDLNAFGNLLDADVRWGGEEETPETCHSRTDVVRRLARQRAEGMQTTLLEVVPGTDAILVGLSVKRPVRGGFGREHTVYQVLKVRDQHVVDIRGYATRDEAAARAGLEVTTAPSMPARQVVPILNVSNLSDSLQWFAKLGWAKMWEWIDPDGTAGFGAIKSGDCEIFLCLNGQGGRGRDGVWMSVWLDDVDAVHATCIRQGIEILRPPQDEPFGVREMHIRHPDGHVLRISQPIHAH